MTHVDYTEIEVGAGGVVEIAGDDLVSVLRVRGGAVHLEGYDCRGSIGKLALRMGSARLSLNELDELCAWLRAPALESIMEHASAVLRFLSPGRYGVRLFTGNKGTIVKPHGGDGLVGWYPHEPMSVLLPTETWPPSDQTTVDAYARRIDAGGRPAAVVLRAEPGKVASTAYILDGHHKLAAYADRRVRPRLLDIAHLDARPLTRAEVDAVIPSGHPRRAYFDALLNSRARRDKAARPTEVD